MANYCYYEMKVVGKENNVKELVKYLEANYEYKGNELVMCEADKHFFRVFYAEVIDEYGADKGYINLISGDCAWSTFSCMLKGEHSYYDIFKNRKGFKGTNLVDASRDLSLDIEVFSEEPGCGFMEHYLIKQGVMDIDECENYEETYNEEIDEYEKKGGFTWDFTI